MKDQATQSHKGGVHISEHIKESTPVEGMHLFTLKNSAERIVIIMGSMLGGRMYSPKENPALADLVVAMLDQGTVKKIKTPSMMNLNILARPFNFLPVSSG